MKYTKQEISDFLSKMGYRKKGIYMNNGTHAIDPDMTVSELIDTLSRAHNLPKHIIRLLWKVYTVGGEIRYISRY